jgi:general secretion pathway protein G
MGDGNAMPRDRGFTLLELLIAMALIALLLSLAVPRYLGTVDKAKESALRHDLAVMRDAIDKYVGDHGRYPDSLDDIVARRYLRQVPVDPITERKDSWKIVPPPQKNMGAVFDVHSGAAGRARDGSEYASW